MTAFIAALIPLMAAGLAFGANTIKDSAHNFTKYSWSGNEICKPCHTPHNAIAPDVSERLWNHTLSTATYKMRDDLGLPNNQGGPEVLDGVSRLCMSCHDGTVALDAFGGKTNPSTYIQDVNQNVNMGTDLTDDHPVGVYAVYQTESGRYNPMNADGKTVGVAKLRLVNIGTTRSYTDKTSGQTVTAANMVVGCGTCHNAHGSADASGKINDHLLATSNYGSALCLTCHPK